MSTWAATYGIKQGRGGWLVTEQSIVEATDYFSAHKIGRSRCKRGETLMALDPIHDDLDLLDYDAMDVI